MSDKPVRVALYCRTSTDRQGTANQEEVLTRWAEGRGWQIVEVYREQESAWKSGHQRELSRLVHDARKGRFQVLCVFALDRVSREGPLAILTLVHRLGQYGYRVYSYSESWTEAPSEVTDLLYSLTGWIAQQESKRISERTKAGLQRAVREGKTLGRPKGARDKRRRKKRSVRPVEGWTPFWLQFQVQAREP